MQNQVKTYFLLSILLFFSLVSIAQVHDHIDFHAEHEGCKKAGLVLQRSTIQHYGYDMIFQRIVHYSEPSQTILKGTVTCYIKAQDNLDTIKLDMAESLVIDSIMYHGNSLNYDHQDKVLKIILPSTISATTIDSVSITYEGPPGTSDAYENDFHGALSQNIPVIWTDSEPYFSRDWYPCKMSLDDKIDSVDLIISCPAEYRSASNGLIVSDVIENGIRTTHWKHRYPIANYLVAYAVTNYMLEVDYSIMPNGDTLEIHNYVWPEDNLPGGDQPHGLLPEVLEFFNEKFVPYPYANEKYGHARWLGPGAMENQTMTFTYNYGISLLAHELAHHWFGNYVTCGSWQDIWLNESFATFTEGLVHEKYYPELWPNWKAIKIDAITDYPGGSVFVYDTTYFGNIFHSRLTYKKGAMMIFMLRWEIGDDAFFQGINNYLTDPALTHGFAVSDDMINHWELAADTNLTEFFDDWLYGEGYPTYELSYTQNTNLDLELIIHQSQSVETANHFEMHVPVLFEGENIDTMMVFHNLYDGETFVFNPGFEVTNIEFDPEYNIISRNSFVTRINEADINNGFWVYPNPAGDIFQLRLDDNRTVSSLEILDLSGKIVKVYNQDKTGMNEQKFDISELPIGSYIIRIKTDEDILISKLVKI